MFEQLKFSRFFPIAALLAITVILLTACVSQPSATPAAAVQLNNNSASAPTAAAPGAANPASPAQGSVSFSKDLTPIFQNSCVSCHGGDRTSVGLDLKAYASLMAGSQNGAVIVASDAANSLLVQKIQSGSMPKRGTKLTPGQLQLFVDWVNAGAQNN